jgi:acetyl esterase/lipase
MSVVSIDYRLAPHTTYPDSFQDCLDAVDWAVDHAEELGFDATRIGVWGDSAGGHLALLLACSQTHPSFPGPRMRASRTALKAVVAFYPPTDLERLYASEQRAGILEASVVRAFVGRRPEEDTARWREASPIEHVHENLPPIFLLQGTHDMLVPKSQAIRFAERLVQVGAEHRLEIIEDGVHGFDRIAPSPQTVELIEETRRFLTERLAAG